MPAQTTKSILFSKLGDRMVKAHEEHKNDEVRYSNAGELPPGIENGIAQLVDCKFDLVKEGAQSAGQPYFYAAGVVLVPREHTYRDLAGKPVTVPVEGMRTSVMLTIMDNPKSSTRKTVSDCMDWIYNEMRKLGAEPGQIDLRKDPGGLERLAAALKQARPYFKFRTWVGSRQDLKQRPDGRWELFNDNKPSGKVYATEDEAKRMNPYAGRDPRVQHVWNGLTDYTPPEDAGGVDDHTAAGVAADVNGQTLAASGSGSADAFRDGEFEGQVGDDLDALVAAATGDDPEAEQARARLEELAVAAGHEKGEVHAATNWNDVKSMIENPIQADGEESSSGPEASPDPEKGSTCKYRPTDPRTKAPAKRPVDCEVIAVDKKSQTVTLKNLTNKAVYQKVPWDKLDPS